MTDLVTWLQENVLWLLATQLVVVAGFAGWLFVNRLRRQTARGLEPAAGDRNTVVLPEDDAQQMFATLSALQEELERYRRAAGPLPPESAGSAGPRFDEDARFEQVPIAFNENDARGDDDEAAPRSTGASAAEAGTRVLEDLVEGDPEQELLPREILDERRSTVPLDDEDSLFPHVRSGEVPRETPPEAPATRAETAPKAPASEAERILKEWFADLEELTRRSRREAL